MRPCRDCLGYLIFTDDGIARCSRPLPFFTFRLERVACSNYLIAHACRRFEILRAHERFFFYPQCSKSALQRPYLLGLAALLYPFFCGGFIDEIYCLVGQKSVAEISHREPHSRIYRLVCNLHAVVVLIALAKSAQDIFRLRRIRLAY